MLHWKHSVSYAMVTVVVALAAIGGFGYSWG